MNDFDQIFIRPLPEDKMPLISREMQWRRSQCNKNSTDCQKNPDGCFAKTSYCQEIGVDDAVPAQYQRRVPNFAVNYRAFLQHHFFDF